MRSPAQRVGDDEVELDMSLSIGRRSGLRSLVQRLVVGAVVGAVLNSRDIRRYLTIREM